RSRCTEERSTPPKRSSKSSPLERLRDGTCLVATDPMRLLLAAGVLCAAFLTIYLPAVGHGCVKDVCCWILSSRSERLSDLIALFTSNVGFYRPLVALTFAADYGIWGMRPFGYGLTNLIGFRGSAACLD